MLESFCMRALLSIFPVTLNGHGLLIEDDVGDCTVLNYKRDPYVHCQGQYDSSSCGAIV